MPKSKRDKIVSLTKVKKKTKETKGKLIEEVRECLSKYNNLFVFSTANLRSNILIKVRQRFKQTSRIFYGRNSVMAVALGKTPEQEVENGLYHIAQLLKGQCGLMFTNEMKDSILSFFDEFVEEEFARAGDSAPFEIVIPAGPVHVDDDGIDDEEHKKWVTSSFEPQLRKLGLQTRKIELLDQFVVCKEGDKLSSDQTKILRHFGRRLVEFRVTLLAHWTKKNGFKRLKEFVPKSAEEMEQD